MKAWFKIPERALAAQRFIDGLEGGFITLHRN